MNIKKNVKKNDICIENVRVKAYTILSLHIYKEKKEVTYLCVLLECVCRVKLNITQLFSLTLIETS